MTKAAECHEEHKQPQKKAKKTEHTRHTEAMVQLNMFLMALHRTQIRGRPLFTLGVWREGGQAKSHAVLVVGVTNLIQLFRFNQMHY